ncbi:MAG: hypothetical protein H7A24_05630 [Leptospiraceae bacterium]|nr:hypothetical protein [Leptospiraceae bacterium]MCP5511339.1 hypothetical protein [Leptospiraceae bacterium]
MKHLNFIFLLIFISTSLTSGEFSFGKGKKYSLRKLKKENTIIKKIGSNEDRIELSKNRIAETELFLNFENKKAADLRDQNRNYEVQEALYTPIEGKSLFGRRFASFTTRDSQIRISSGSGRILSQKVISKPIYFSYFIMPGELEQSSSIFSKSYTTGGKKYGIESKIINSKTEVYFHNFFFYTQSESKSFSLISPDKLKSKVWTHVVISLQPLTGEAILFENGSEKAKFQAFRSPNDPTPLLAGFHPYDTSPLIIGKDFYGKLDNFIIGTGEVENINKINVPYSPVNYNESFRTANHSRGVVTSAVMKTPKSHSLPISMEIVENQPDGTHIEILYRFSEEPFEENSVLPEWKHYNKDEFKKSESNHYFQYFQWKAILRANSEGTVSPYLSELALNYKDSFPPNPPFGLEIQSYDHDKKEICLKWNSNHEADVIDGGGYMIHYGVSPDRMVATLTLGNDGKPISGISMDGSGEALPLKKVVRKNYSSLRTCINNDIIQKNAEFTKDKNLLLFKSGITYFFKISAYNNKFPLLEDEKPGRDQRSKPSKEVLFTFQTDANDRY